MCNTDYDPADLYQQSVRRARKEHRCAECYRRIEAGETYRYVFGVWSGVSSSYHVCQHCNIALLWLVAECIGFMHGGIKEEIHEHAQEYNRSTAGFSLYRIAIGMDRKWRRKDGTMMPPPKIPSISQKQGRTDRQ